MPEFTFDPILFFPFILGIYRINSYIFLKFIPSLLYKPYKTEDIKPETIKYKNKDVTYVVPLYQSDLDFEYCLKSWITNNPKKIILVVDYTSYKQIYDIVEKVKEEYDEELIPEIEVVEEFKPGKRNALFTGYGKTDTDIIAFVDDDVYHHDGYLENLLLPFNDEKKNIGGVSSKQMARPKPNDDWNIWDIFMDMRLHQRMVEVRATTLIGGGATCISGRTMSFRKSLLDEKEDFEDYFLKETFMGKLQLSGDDKCLTRLCINSDYGMYHQVSEHCCLTTKFEDPPVLLKQILRWGRNTWRSDFKLLFLERKVWCKYPFLSILMLDRFISPFSMLTGPVLITITLIFSSNYFILVAALVYIILTRSLKMIPYFFADKPARPKLWILFIPAFIIFQYFTAILKIYSLFTLGNRKWGNREIKVNKDDEIVRTIEKNDILAIEDVDTDNVKIDVVEI